MKTLVIGGAGFLGGHLIPILLGAGHEVTVQEVIPAEGAAKLRDIIDKIGYSWKSALDITPEDVRKFDAVIHLAAQGDVPLAISSPKWTYAANLDPVIALLEATRYRESEMRTSNFKLVFMSTDNVYGRVPPERLPVSEDEPLHPTNSYGASKAAAELLIDAYVTQWNLPIIVLRSSSMFGEGSRLRQVIPIFIRQALKGEPITIEGDGSQSRDLNYVKNTATAILNAISASVRSGTWNIGSGKETTIRQLAELIIKITGSRSKIVEKPWRPGEQGLRLPLSIDKARRDLKYSPAYSQEDALKRTADWIRGLG